MPSISGAVGTRFISIVVGGEVQAIEALAGVSKDAAFAQKTAMRSAARKARRDVAVEVAGHFGLPQKVLRKRIRFFLRRSDINTADARLWTGVKRKPKQKEHRSILAAVRAQNPNGFMATMKSGHRGYFIRLQDTRPYGPGARERKARRPRGALPIREPALDISPVAEPAMIEAARRHMKTTYRTVLLRDYQRRISRQGRRRRRR